MEKKEGPEERLKKIIDNLSGAFDRTFTEEKLVEQIETILFEKDLRIRELESKLQEERKAKGIVTGEDVLINLRHKNVKI